MKEKEMKLSLQSINFVPAQQLYVHVQYVSTTDSKLEPPN